MRIIDKLKMWGCFMAASLALAACSGTSADEEMTLTLKANKTSIDANGRDVVTFTVDRSGLDVTKEAEVRCVTTGKVVPQTGFSTTEPNTYTFEASYGGMVTEQVSVSAVEVKPSAFVRKVCLMEFTATNCAFCPSGYRGISPVLRDYPDQVYLLSMHPESFGGVADPMGLPQTSELESIYKIDGYPKVLIDMRDRVEPKAADIREVLKKSFGEYQACCGVAVSSAYNEAANEFQVTVKLHSEKEQDYRIVLYVVEDGIIAPQLDNGVTIDDYKHHKVARQVVGENVNGEKIGKVAAGQEVEKTLTVQRDASWNTDNLFIYAIALGEDGTVNNMNVCRAVNGDSGYAKVNENN